jgi:hypothetical protein
MKTWFDTSINRRSGTIDTLTINQEKRNGARERVVLSRDELTSLIRRINGDLKFENGEFKLVEPDAKAS